LSAIYDYALRLIEKGISVIPVDGATKRPTIESWKPYQDRVPTEAELSEWERTGKLKGIARVTGRVSSCVVVDCDSQEAHDKMREHCPDVMETPTVNTPRGGIQYYFEYTNGLINRAGYYPDLDIRTDGGYANIPPTENGNGKSYTFVPGMSFDDVQPLPFPEALKRYLLSSPNLNKYKDASSGAVKGERNQTLTQYIGQILKQYQGMTLNECTNMAYGWNRNNRPPLKALELERTVKSIWESDARNHPERHNTGRTGNDLTEKLTSYFNEMEAGPYYLKTVYDEVGAKTPEEKDQVRQFIRRLEAKDNGQYKKDKSVNGKHYKLDLTLEDNDWFNSEDSKGEPIILPLGLSSMLHIPAGEIILLAGVTSAGKTGQMMNLIKDNISTWKINYFNVGETRAARVHNHLKKFQEYQDAIQNGTIDLWRTNLKHYDFDSPENLADLIKYSVKHKGKGTLHLIDYVILHDNPFHISKILEDIHQSLNGAIAVIAIQQLTSTGKGMGGDYGTFKPTLILSLTKDKNLAGEIFRAEIRKGKFPIKGGSSHDWKSIEYQLKEGVHIYEIGSWGYDKTKK
jgi:hypothetical protein